MDTGSIVVVVGYVIITLAIGLYCSKKYTGTIDGYFVGGRTLGPWLLAFTYGASYYSSSIMIGNAGTGYISGMGWLWQPPLIIIGTPLGITLFAYGLRKMSTMLGVYSVPDFIGQRYRSPIAGGIVAVVIILFLIPYGVAIVRGGALTVATVFNLSYNASVVLLVLVAGIYMVAGGFMARVYTDFIQGIIMFFGTTLVFIVAMFAVRGPANIARELAIQNPQLTETPGPLGWEGIFLFTFAFAIGTWGMPQLAQSMFAMKSRKVIYPTAIMLAFFAATILFFSNANGIMGRVLYGDMFLDTPDMIFPHMVRDMLPNLVAALILVAVIAAAMSTIDSMLLSAGMAFSNDLYKRFFNPKVSDNKLKNLTMVAMIVVTLIIMVAALNPPYLLLELTIYAYSVISVSILTPMFMGLYWKKGTAAGCLASQITGVLSVVLWYQFNSPGGIPPFVAGLVISIVVFIVVSLKTKQLPSEFVEWMFGDKKDMEMMEIKGNI